MVIFRIMRARAVYSKDLRQVRWCAETDILVVKVCFGSPSWRIAKACRRDERAVSWIRQGQRVDERGQGSTYVVRDVREMEPVVDSWILLAFADRCVFSLGFVGSNISV